MIRRFVSAAAMLLLATASIEAQPLVTPATGFSATGGFRLRGGNQGPSGDAELFYGAEWAFSPPPTSSAQGAFTFNQALAFTLSYNGSNTLNFSWNGFRNGDVFSTSFSGTPSFNALQFTANAGANTTVTLSGMNYGIADLTATGNLVTPVTATYGNLRNDEAWEITGTLRMDGTRTANERPQVQFQIGTAQFAEPAQVPEPASVALLATGLAGLVTAARRRRA